MPKLSLQYENTPVSCVNRRRSLTPALGQPRGSYLVSDVWLFTLLIDKQISRAHYAKEVVIDASDEGFPQKRLIFFLCKLFAV